MSTKKERESKENLEKCFKLVQQSCAKGISATDIAKKMNMDRSTIYNYLNSLTYQGRVESRQGNWNATEQLTAKTTTSQSSEKEIIIELPPHEKDIHKLALLESKAKDFENLNPSRTNNAPRILLEKYKASRIIRITGKNVDDLDLEKVGKLIQEYNIKRSRTKLERLFGRRPNR